MIPVNCKEVEVILIFIFYLMVIQIFIFDLIIMIALYYIHSQMPNF